MRLDLIKPEIDDLKARFMAEDYEVVFGHHDLQHGNILMNKDGDIMFVDFEYAGQISVGVDIANHFCEWMTHYDSPSYWIDMALHPTREEETNFLVAYLETRSR